MKKMFYFLFFVLIIVLNTSAYALTAEEMLLLKRGGISDEKILEIQRKEGVTPTAPKINLFDWNEDGKKDIISGSNSGRVYAYLNKGTNQQPVYDKPIEISDVEIMKLSKPYMADLNNDGKKDFIIGSGSGEISLFINKGTNQQPVFVSEIKLNGGRLDVGDDSSPAIVDWNGDGKKDLVVGNKKGEVYVFLNIGEDYAPEFQSTGIKTEIKVPGYATPFIVNWNNDGKFDVVCGSKDGKVYIFINEGNEKVPKFGKAQVLYVNNKELKLPPPSAVIVDLNRNFDNLSKFETANFTIPTSVIALDWDEDGKTDLLVSNKEIKEKDTAGREYIISPGIYLLLNTGTKEKPEFKELKEIKGKFRDDTVL